MRNRVVIVTGASSGLGAATARRLGVEGAWVALAARRRDALEDVAAEVRERGGQALVVPTDVGDRDAVRSLVHATLDEWGRIDVLINNAGLGYRARVVDLVPDEVREEVQTNLVAVMDCAQAVLPAMIARRSGHIVNIASIAGLIGVPGSSVYSATKFGVVGFSEALRREVGRYHIKVSAFCPGFIATNLSPELRSMVERRRRAPGVMSADYAARQLVSVVRHPRRVYIIPRGAPIAVAIARVCPWLTDFLLGIADRQGITARRE